MSDKKLALAFQFENAPQEVKDVAAEHRGKLPSHDHSRAAGYTLES
jgi:hypothetical protein